jgi:hypothetical protein
MAKSNKVRLAVLEERSKNTDHALKLQRKEYARRLKQLNGEAGRIRDVQDKSVTAEKFDDYVQSEREARELALRAVTAKTDDNASAIALLVQSQLSRSRVTTLAVSVVGVVIAAIAVVKGIR